jgi:ribose/xylose/arabinose/galactoside ABC-type transport system permease subunit
MGIAWSGTTVSPRRSTTYRVIPGRPTICARRFRSGCTRSRPRSAISSILYTGRLETGTPVLGQRILLDVIGAAVIGGVSLFGGKGKILWTVFGVLFLSVIDKSLQLLGLPIASVFAIKGSIIMLAAIIDATRHRLLARS